MAHNGGAATFGYDATTLFDLYDRLYDTTKGCVTPLIGDTLSQLGYDKDYSFTPKVTKPAKDYHAVVTRAGATLTLSEPALLDFGAAGKGHLVDRLAAIFGREHASFVIDGSGDIYSRGAPQVIGLEHPDDPTKVIGQVSINDGALCGSATNRRAWGNGLHHIVDPFTARPVNDIRATWVIARTTLLADGLATALFFTNPQELAAEFAFQYVLVRTDGTVESSRAEEIEIYE